MKILVACEESQEVCKAFRAKGRSGRKGQGPKQNLPRYRKSYGRPMGVFMKRPFLMCKKIVDDGLPCPPNADPEMMKKSHKVCKHCLPDFERYAAGEMKKLAARKMMGGEI